MRFNERRYKMAKNLTNNQLLLKECITQDYKESNTYTDLSSFFEFFAASQVLKNYNFSDEEIENGIVGGGNDGGCDGIYILLNDEIVNIDQLESITASKGSTLELCIIQAKNETGFKEDAILKWRSVSENLLSMSNSLTDYVGRYTEAVLESFKLFRDLVTKFIRNQIKIKINYYYVTLANECHPNTIKQAEELKKKINEIYPSANINVNFVDANLLMDMYNSDSEVTISLNLADNPITLSNKDYVALVNVGTFFKFISDENGILRKAYFESNVRDYQGHNSVNSCIAETLASTSSEDFWWLNNGITILATNITLITSKSLLLINPEIVNGLQTSREIYNYFSSNKHLIDNEKRNVLVRIISPESEESRDNIIFATNNQTSIPKSSLRVTDTIHLQIEMYFKNRGLYYDRRKNYYKNQKKKASDIITVSFLAQCLITLVLRKPDFARARPSTLLTDDDTYHKLYEENNNLEAYYRAARIGRIIQNNLKLTTEMTPAEKSDVLFYLIYAVAKKISQKQELSFNDLKDFNLEQLTDEKINECKSLIFNRYKELGGNGRVAKSSTFINEIDSLLDKQNKTNNEVAICC